MTPRPGSAVSAASVSPANSSRLQHLLGDEYAYHMKTTLTNSIVMAAAAQTRPRPTGYKENLPITAIEYLDLHDTPRPRLLKPVAGPYTYTDGNTEDCLDSNGNQSRMNFARPLSDIREATEPDLSQRSGLSPTSRSQARVSTDSTHSGRLAVSGPGIPRRSSSQRLNRRGSRNSGVSFAPPLAPPPPAKGLGLTIPSRGPSRSPVRAAAARRNPVSMESLRKIPSRTFVRTSQPDDIVEFPHYKHPRVSLDVRISAPLFMGGGTVEGKIHLTVDGGTGQRARRSAVSISRIMVDVLGVEEACNKRRSIFLSVANEMVDADHPPPATMLTSPSLVSPADCFWEMAPSTSDLPFLLNLPLNVGPASFHSKHARIRYILCVTIVIKVSGKQYWVRQSQDIAVLSVFDPEKALVSLPSPLVASDEHIIRKGEGYESIKITAGMHRQNWVSGTSIFVDVYIANNSHKTISRVEIQLERVILLYKHAPASTTGKTASHLRISDGSEKKTIGTTIVKGRTLGWKGLDPWCTDTRTFEVEVPRGHSSVKPGRYFEVRYFLNVFVGSTFSAKLVMVQLPVVVIHMNSLDVLPNSMGQVAAAIEAKRGQRSPGGRSHQSHRSQSSKSLQGRAFAAPRKQSLARLRNQSVTQEDIQNLTKVLDGSPRKIRKALSFDVNHLKPIKKSDGLEMDDPPKMQRNLRHAASAEGRHPKLRSSTSGLGYTDTDETDSWNTKASPVNYWTQLETRHQSELNNARRNRSGSGEDWKNVVMGGNVKTAENIGGLEIGSPL
ncbi:MAG: hypothetical protein M1812_002701 [Candelaria pacifica]|nr:MAG: hypothetical protein M1812_002701 [Candelaria pacifica]